MKVAIITGGTRGIGAAVSSLLLNGREKWHVISVSKNSPPVIARDDKAIRYITADLGIAESIDYVVHEIKNTVDRVDLLLNNAGAIAEADSYQNIDDYAAVSSYRLHCVSPLLLAKGLQSLIEHGENSSIVNVGSVYGSIADVDVAAYTMAKSAIPIMTKLMAKAFAPKVRVNCVLPGHVDTDMTKSAPKEFVDSVIRKTLLKRLASADEIAEVICFIASSSSRFITGASILVDGGYILSEH
ncbi:MAG: SDR family oxidoreductase [Deltaproteobacteria bacterium]|nr:SDR family oxidoreductase [Deltaproteobacteria bacterium]